MDRHLASLEELQAEAARFAGTLSPRTGRATLVTLSGELGAGKTSFAQGLAAALGVAEPVTSPTFVLEKAYALPDGAGDRTGRGFARLAHLDAYRLEGDRALEPLGFAERLADPQTLILLEWPEMVAAELPEPDIRISLAVDGDGRRISYA